MFFAKLYAFVGDGDALNHIIHCKGGVGFKMCFCCDVCDHAANLQVGYTPPTCLDDSRIVYMNDEAVLAMMSDIAGIERQADANVRGAKNDLKLRPSSLDTTMMRTSCSWMMIFKGATSDRSPLVCTNCFTFTS